MQYGPLWSNRPHPVDEETGERERGYVSHFLVPLGQSTRHEDEAASVLYPLYIWGEKPEKDGTMSWQLAALPGLLMESNEVKGTQFGIFPLWGRFTDFVTFGKDNLDAVIASSTLFAKGMQDLNAAWFGYAQASLEDSFAATKAVLDCKSVPEAVEVQRELAQEKVAKLVAESRKLSDLSVKVAEKAMAPITGRVTVAVEKFSKPAAA